MAADCAPTTMPPKFVIEPAPVLVAGRICVPIAFVIDPASAVVINVLEPIDVVTDPTVSAARVVSVPTCKVVVPRPVATTV